jgi:hypothetical protein
MNDPVLHGGCLCGAVTFELSPPFIAMYHCHCSRCRKSSGGAHATNLRATAGQVRWLTGEQLIARYRLPTAQRFGKWFCSQCGSPLPRVIAEADVAVIPAGSLDDVPPDTPTAHIFWQSRVPWSCAQGSLPAYEGYPPPK